MRDRAYEQDQAEQDYRESFEAWADASCDHPSGTQGICNRCGQEV